MNAAASIAISSAANAQAAAANSSAQDAKRTACMTYVNGYQHDRATVAEMRSYAECIDRLYPQEFAINASLVAKGVVTALVAGVLIGIFKECRDSYSKNAFEIAFMGVALGLFVSGCVMLILS